MFGVVCCVPCVHEDRTYRVQGQQRGRGGVRRHGCETKSPCKRGRLAQAPVEASAAAAADLNSPVDSLPLPAVSDDSAFSTSSFRQPLAKIDSSDFHMKRTGGVTAAAGGARRQRLPDQQLRYQVQ